eukprot:365722-Chlamydomonas_euryale.AAC.6
MDGWMDGRMDGWMDGCRHGCLRPCNICPSTPLSCPPRPHHCCASHIYKYANSQAATPPHPPLHCRQRGTQPLPLLLRSALRVGRSCDRGFGVAVSRFVRRTRRRYRRLGFPPRRTCSRSLSFRVCGALAEGGNLVWTRGHGFVDKCDCVEGRGRCACELARKQQISL